MCKMKSLALVLVLAAAGPALPDGLFGSSMRLPSGLSRSVVAMPRAWPGVVEALTAAHRQTGLRYAVVPARFEGVLGPFALGEKVKLSRLLSRVAGATGSTVSVVGGVAVFDPKSGAGLKPCKDARARVCRLARSGRSSVIPELSKLVAHDSASVRHHALAALSRMEGDFIRRAWPGRVSIFEVLRTRLDRDAMLWALGEGYRRGSPGWQMIVDVLARAREPYLARYTWAPVWEKTPGTVQMGLWALGRSGNPDGRAALAKRVRKSFTNDPADRYLAAVGLGWMNQPGTLKRRNFTHRNPEVRRATVLGLGLCKGTDAVVASLEKALKDTDPGVRFLACQSLGRVGTPKALAVLAKLVIDEKAYAELRCAALDGLALANSAAAARLIFDAAADADPVIRAKAADQIGRLGGAGGYRQLVRLVLNDKDRWVRASAACSLGVLGTQEAVATVVQYLDREGTDIEGRIAAILGLGRGRAPSAAKPLSRIALSTDVHIRLRRYAVLALAQLAKHAGQATLKTLTKQDLPTFLPFALRHLDLATRQDTAKHLIDYLAKGRSPTVCAAACRLAELGESSGVRELLEGSNVFGNHARMMHMWGAVRAEGPGVVEMLIAATKNRRATLRRAAALALGGRVDVDAVDALIALTRDKSSSVRSQAAQALGLCGDPAAIPSLVALAREDDDLRTASAAIRSLRFRAFNSDRRVRELFAQLAGTPRDAGVIAPGRPALKDQPAHSFVLRRWAGALRDDTICNVTYESSLTYDRDRGRVVLWGAHGRRADSPQTAQTWFFYPDTGKWHRLLASRERPNGTCCIWSSVYDPSVGCVVLPISSTGGGHGWVNELRARMQYSFPWLLDGRTNQWYPVKPAKHKGGINMCARDFDPRHAVSVWWYGTTKAYDAYANAWWTMSPRGAGPANVRNTGGAFDPKTGKLLIVAASSTWAFDPATQKWTDLKPDGAGPAGCKTVYDAANDVMLAFQPGRSRGVAVHVYHVRENRWEKLPVVHPSPHYGTFDVAYDSRHNVTVINGGWESGRSAETTVRETWTYRYQPARGPDLSISRPRALTATTKAGGTVVLTWKRPARGKVAGYSIHRGTGSDRAWLATWKPAGDVKAAQLTFTDKVVDPAKLVFYRVTAVDAAGREGPVSFPARTAPPALRWTAAVYTGAGVRVKWPASTAKDVVGYHVYRAPVDARSHWAKAFNPMSLLGKFQRVTGKPVNATEWVDKAAKIAGPASEVSWPATFAYAVRAVNALGVEGGPGPTTLAVPDAPGPVRVIPWLDGRRLVMWAPGRIEQVRGYYVMRMDDWHGRYIYRWHASPLAGYGFYDDDEFPTADRRRYYVSGIDVTGAVGIPSSGAWSHGFP